MNDGELIQSWEPGPPTHVMIMEFSDPEDMLRVQERVTKELCRWLDHGERIDKVRTEIMSYGSIGRRQLMDGNVETVLFVTTGAAVRETELARRAWAHENMLRPALELEKTKLADAMTPSSEQEDWFDKWTEAAIVVVPAEGGLLPAAKSSAVRAGFNSFVEDNGRPDLAMAGSGGGRALSALLKRRYGEGMRRATNDSGNPYFLGLARKEGAKKSWFPNTSPRHIA